MRTLLAAAAVLLVALAGAATSVYLLTVKALDIYPAVVLDIAPGARARDVARQLEAEGVIRNALVLEMLAKTKGLDTKVRHGEHRFEGRMTPAMVLEELVTAPREPGLRVTIPEGLRWQEIAALLENSGIVDAAAYRASVCDPAFVARSGAAPGANCAEGYLFPDTYELAAGATAAQIADLQLARFHKLVGPLLVPERAAADAGAGQGGSPDHAAWRNRVLVLASIVEKETAKPEERPLVAAVLLNRLTKGMKLQTDPTVIYGILAAGRPWDGNLTKAQLREPGPYNTYTTTGLPPGPICNPGLAAIKAVLEPADADYLYFVSRGDGSHEFSASYAGHRAAVKKYQLR